MTNAVGIHVRHVTNAGGIYHVCHVTYAILHTAQQLLWQNFGQHLYSQTTLHTSPLRASYGVSFLVIQRKMSVIYRERTVSGCTGLLTSITFYRLQSDPERTFKAHSHTLTVSTSICKVSPFPIRNTVELAWLMVEIRWPSNCNPEESSGNVPGLEDCDTDSSPEQYPLLPLPE